MNDGACVTHVGYPVPSDPDGLAHPFIVHMYSTCRWDLLRHSPTGPVEDPTVGSSTGPNMLLYLNGQATCTR